jgi:hypothetical protein
MTLVFLGQTDLASMLERLSGFPDPGFRIGLAGYFDAPLFLPEKHPRTAGGHVRLFEGEETLARFQQKLVSWLRLLEKDFLPHVTIARDPKDIPEWKEAFSPLPLYLQHIHLYKSLGFSEYESLWHYPILPPFEEQEHTADIAYTVRGESWQSLQLHASLALAFQFPPLLPFFEPKQKPTNFTELIGGLNRLIAKADAECGAPFKAVSYHGDVRVSPEGIWEWEMIVDV